MVFFDTKKGAFYTPIFFIFVLDQFYLLKFAKVNKKLKSKINKIIDDIIFLTITKKLININIKAATTYFLKPAAPAFFYLPFVKNHRFSEIFKNSITFHD